jgi:hypothetical protein
MYFYNFQKKIYNNENIIILFVTIISICSILYYKKNNKYNETDLYYNDKKFLSIILKLSYITIILYLFAHFKYIITQLYKKYY